MKYFTQLEWIRDPAQLAVDLRELADMLDLQIKEKEFDLSCWLDDTWDGDKSCGTIGCVLGHATERLPRLGLFLGRGLLACYVLSKDIAMAERISDNEQLGQGGVVLHNFQAAAYVLGAAGNELRNLFSCPSPYYKGAPDRQTVIKHLQLAAEELDALDPAKFPGQVWRK